MRRVSVWIITGLCVFSFFPAGSCVSPEVKITSFQVIPSSIAAGQSASLQWNVSGVTAVTISGGPGQQPPYGNLEVQPAQTTTYTLTAKNGNKSVESSVTLTVNVPAVSPTTAAEPVLTISALDTEKLISHIGEQVRVDGDVTYISSWLPTRFQGIGTSQPWTFIFFMKDPLEGAAGDNGIGSCPECWPDYTSYFRVIITPEKLPLLLPVLNNCLGNKSRVRAGYGDMFMPPVHVTVDGQLTSYLSAPAIYWTQPDQISCSQP